MNEDLLNIISVLITAVLIPSISLLGKYLQTKIDNEKAIRVNDVLVNSVNTVLQTYVDDLKKNKQFDKDAQIQAFKKAKEMVQMQLTDEMKKYINKEFKNIDDWLDIQIESYVKILK